MDQLNQWLEALAGAERPTAPAKIVNATQHFGRLHRGCAFSGKAFDVTGGTCHIHGLGTHAPGEITLELAENCAEFAAAVAVDMPGHPVTLEFSVRGENGEALWHSGPVDARQPPKPCRIPVKGMKRLTLTCANPAGFLIYCHADWLDARLILDDGSEYFLDEAQEEFAPLFPISFRYGDTAEDGGFAGWTRKREVDGNWSFTAPDGLLRVSWLVEYRAEYRALEWVWRFENIGATDTPVISELLAADFTWQRPGNAMTLFHSRGSANFREDYLYGSHFFGDAGKFEAASVGGRPASPFMPWFDLNANGRDGLMLGIGWTGNWKANFEFDNDRGMRFAAGMKHTRIKLHPQESIRTPRLLVIRYRGDDSDGSNALRRYLIDCKVPRLDGKIPLPVCCPTWGAMHAKEHLKRIELIQKQRLDYDYYWIDAGWFGDLDSYSPDEAQGEWITRVGDWRENPVCYPEGMKPVADAVHAAGMKFLLWFEPERGCAGTPVVDLHPDWWLGDGAEKLLNLAHPDAQRWMLEMLDEKITRWGIDCYRQDFNLVEPEYLWPLADSPDREGLTEIRAVEGLYAVLDELRRRHPALLIDNCASGGKRQDLEMVSRAISLWRSDYECSMDAPPEGTQSHSHGVWHWVPVNTCGSQYHAGDTYHLRSCYSSGLAFHLCGAEFILPGADYPWDWHRARTAEVRRIAPQLLGDYYALTEPGCGDHELAAWQFHRADRNQGVVMVFRRPQCPATQAEFALRDLDADATYEFENADTGETTDRGGRTLMERGLPVELPERRSSALFFYTQK